jgi:hydroxymethylpyrimidine/phosphomethylpyrimidine kinase
MSLKPLVSPTGKGYYRALTIAGSDSGGGAGIQADLKTFSALGCYGMSVITALTAQNTVGVTGIHPVPPEFVQAQIDAVFSDIGVDAVKIGMLFSAELIQAITEKLKEHDAHPIVLDPVIVAQSGDKLLQDEAIAAIRDYLIPLADIVTPNLVEASVLLDHRLDSPDDIIAGAKQIAQWGCRAVLIKGGHSNTQDCLDVLYLSEVNRIITLSEDRIETRNNHGTGCTLSSAIAAHLARGFTMEKAVKKAKEYITEAIQRGAEYRIGMGHGPVHHFYQFW